MPHITDEEHQQLLQAAAERDRLHQLVNTPELLDFPKAVHLEAVHQEVRWGTNDRKGKQPYDWHWLVAHLATRALEHHKEADRLTAVRSETTLGVDVVDASIRHHREKAVHHVITTAAALNHWHASIVDKATSMQPGSATAIATAEAML